MGSIDDRNETRVFENRKLTSVRSCSIRSRNREDGSFLLALLVSASPVRRSLLHRRRPDLEKRASEQRLSSLRRRSHAFLRFASTLPPRLRHPRLPVVLFLFLSSLRGSVSLSLHLPKSPSPTSPRTFQPPSTPVSAEHNADADDDASDGELPCPPSSYADIIPQRHLRYLLRLLLLPLDHMSVVSSHSNTRRSVKKPRGKSSSTNPFRLSRSFQRGFLRVTRLDASLTRGYVNA